MRQPFDGRGQGPARIGARVQSGINLGAAQGDWRARDWQLHRSGGCAQRPGQSGMFRLALCVDPGITSQLQGIGLQIEFAQLHLAILQPDAICSQF